MAVVELQGAAAANRLLWEKPTERGRTFLLTVLAFTGGAARARIAGGTDVQSGLVSFGHAAELLSRERRATKRTLAGLREPLTRAATAASGARKVIAAAQAAYRYSLMTPPRTRVRRSLRGTRSCNTAGCSGASGGRWSRDRCGRWQL